MDSSNSEFPTPTLDELKTLEEEDKVKEINDLGVLLKRHMSNSEGKFSETLQIDPKGSLKWETSEGKLVSLFSYIAIADEEKTGSGVESLFRLAKRVNDKFPELHFDFEQDQNRTSIKYTVSETQQSKK